jgi:hypothetical protein
MMQLALPHLLVLGQLLLLVRPILQLLQGLLHG